MQDLWPDFSEMETKQEMSRATEILMAQADELEKKTNGKVKAKFSKIVYRNSEVTVVLKNMGSMGLTSESLDPELEDKENINRLFVEELYKFEIYTDTYRFRIFTVKNNPFFPIELTLDEGIKEELPNVRTKIKSNDEFIQSMRKIFHSKKLGVIISKMMESSEDLKVRSNADPQ